MSLMLQLWQHYFLKSTHKLEVPAVCISGSLRVAKPRHSGAPRSIGAQFKVGRTAFSRTSGQRADEGGGGEFRVLVLIIVGVGKERVGALPVVDPPWQPNILPAAGWERMVAACLPSGPLELTESSLACLRHQQQRFWFLWVIVLIIVGVVGVARPAPSPAWKSLISSFHHLRCWS